MQASCTELTLHEAWNSIFVHEQFVIFSHFVIEMCKFSEWTALLREILLSHYDRNLHMCCPKIMRPFLLLKVSRLLSHNFFPPKTDEFVFLYWWHRNTWNLKSKFKFQVFPCLQDRKTNSSICFFGEFMARQFCFEIYWPLNQERYKIKLILTTKCDSSCHIQWVVTTSYFSWKKKALEFLDEIGNSCHSLAVRRKKLPSEKLLTQ